MLGICMGLIVARGGKVEWNEMKKGTDDNGKIQGVYKNIIKYMLLACLAVITSLHCICDFIELGAISN